MTEPTPENPKRFSLLALTLLALFFTLANLEKPLIIDDSAYERYSRQIAQDPLDPYGFSLFWYDTPMQANRILAPPVFLYYWAVIRAALPDDPFVWKLALFPWVWLLAWTLQTLLVRFADRHLRIFLVSLLYSPAILPSMNLMLDVPALCLGLTAIELFLRATERNSWRLVLSAGTLAGLAMQTKYTAFLVPGVFGLWGLLDRHWAKTIVACGIAVALFVGWEAVTAGLYGKSHFLVALGDGGGSLLSKLNLFPFLTSYLGGLVPCLFLVAWLGIGVRRWWMWLGSLAIVLTYLAIALIEVSFTSHARISPALFGPQPETSHTFQLAEVLFNTISAVGLVGLALVAWRLLFRSDDESAKTSRETWFLLAWLGSEILGFFALTPFPAARRLLDVVVVMTLLLARYLSLHPLDASQRRWLVALLCGQVFIGVGYHALDCYGGSRDAKAASVSAEWIRQRDEDATIWYTGHWGFQYYAERQDMQAVVPNYARPETEILMPSPSQLEVGDWLVVPGVRVNQQDVVLPMHNLELVTTLEFGSGIPLRTIPCFYGGRTPIEHHEGAVIRIRILRVTKAFVPQRRQRRPDFDPNISLDPLEE